MSVHSNDPIEKALWDQSVVRHASLADALKHVRTAVPELIGEEDDSAVGTLQWRPGPVELSPSLTESLWTFLGLVDAPDEDIVQFARQFGPLLWPQDSDANETGEQHGLISEPLLAWRTYSRGLNAIYDLATSKSRGDPFESETEAWSFAAISVPLWLRSGFPDRFWTEEYFLEFLTEQILQERGALGVDEFDQIVSATLRVAGVGPAYHLVSEDAPIQAYTIPAVELPPNATVDYWRIWQVHGLLPVLAASIAIAAQSQERPRCTRCNKPAVVVGRRPRRGQPWFGDHTACRAQSRAEAMKRVEAKQAEKRRLRASNDSRTEKER